MSFSSERKRLANFGTTGHSPGDRLAAQTQRSEPQCFPYSCPYIVIVISKATLYTDRGGYTAITKITTFRDRIH